MKTYGLSPTVPGYWTLSQCAALANVSQQTVRRWVSAGRLTPHRAGQRQILVAIDDLDRLLSERRDGAA